MSEEEFHGQFAKEYDSLASQFQTFGSEAIFGLQFDHISPGQNILDIGIGTGLGSRRFHRFGMEVYGVDISKKMLDECLKKGFAKELKILDITSEPFPYADDFFHHVVSHGVLHLFDDLSMIFEEVSRIIRPGGTFAFNIMSDENGGPEGDEIIRRTTRWEKEINYHGREYIKDLLKRNYF